MQDSFGIGMEIGPLFYSWYANSFLFGRRWKLSSTLACKVFSEWALLSVTHGTQIHTPFLFPFHVQECSKSWLSQDCKMSFAWRCILASCWFFSASINGTGWNNSTDILGAENHFGNGHFLETCWHLLSYIWQRNVLWVSGGKAWKIKTENLGKNTSCGQTMILQPPSLVDRWRNTCRDSLQGNFVLMEETKACKHGNFVISLPLPARSGCGFAPVKLHYFGTAGLLGSLFLLSLPLSSVLLTARSCLHLPAGIGAHWLLQCANQAGNSSLRKKPS